MGRNRRNVLLGFVDYFDGIDTCVVVDRHHRDHQLAMSVRMQVAEGPVDWAFGAVRFFKNIEVMGQHLGIAQNVESSAPYAAAARLVGSEPGFGELQGYAVGTGRHWDDVTEIAVTLALIQLRIIHAAREPGAQNRLAAAVVAIGHPQITLPVGVRLAAHGDANRPHPAWESRYDFNRVDEGIPNPVSETQVKLAIGVRRDIFKDAFVRDVRAGGVRDHVEVIEQQRMVGNYLEQPAGLAPSPRVMLPVDSFGKW